MSITIDVDFRGDGYVVRDGLEMHRYRVTLSHAGRTMAVDYFRGMGLEDSELTAAEVLYCVLLDMGYEDHEFDEFCDEFGYDPDSRNAYAMWEAVREQCADFRALVGDDGWEIIRGMLDETDGETVAARIAGVAR